MECPNCQTLLDDNQKVCTKCNKVLLLECPNCHNLGESAICEKCGFTILTKCSKCNKIVPVTKEKCKCGFSTTLSLAYQECESDEFATIVLKFGALKNIKRQLKSTELYTKFVFKLKNLLYAQLKGVECKIISYDDIFAINFNKELSFATSSNKAVRTALKIMNAFSSLNLNVLEEFATPLNLTLTIVKKVAENLQLLPIYENNVKPLVIKKNQKKFSKGMQVILDQYVQDVVHKDFKTDSLYSIEENGKTLMFYEVVLDSYLLPPINDSEESSLNVQQQKIEKKVVNKSEKDLYSFKVFDINAKCKFDKCSAIDLFDKLSTYDLDKTAKILSIRAQSEFEISTSDIVEFYKMKGYRVLSVCCTEAMNYKPWGFFEKVFKDYFELGCCNNTSKFSHINETYLTKFKALFDLLKGRSTKTLSSEDARYFYMELWNKFLASLDNTLILIEGFEFLDDTSIQTLELYFDKFKNVKPNFVFVTNRELALHSKFKGLLRTSLYTELILFESSIDSCLSLLKSDATDFIQSFYYEKIKENFNGSYLYFKNALEYLKETGVLIDFENKLLIKNKKSIIVPNNLRALYRARMRNLSKNQDLSMILAYASILGARLDLNTLKVLGIKDVDSNVKKLVETNLARLENDVLYINNFNLVEPIITESLKKEAEVYLAKNVLAQLGKQLDDTAVAIIMGKIGLYKEEYLTLWKNSQFAMKTGDYDAYLKNCLGFLSLVEHINTNVSAEDIENNKKEVYNNILMSLYSYSPSKIYYIENLLLMDAINQGDDEKIVKLSNLMLQGALATSNYSDALGLLHNILSRMDNPMLIVDNNINTRFLLLSLVKIEVLYNIGDFRQCVEIAEEMLSVLSPDVVEKVKPAGFSTNLFVTHILETFKLVAFSKLYLLDDDLEEFFERVKEKIETELQERDCILAIKSFLAGKVYDMGNIEEYNAFSKVVFLLLQEFSVLEGDYKRFAQNIYQAKLLALEIHQAEIEKFCDLMIAFAYSKIGLNEKAESIYADVLQDAEQTAKFNILVIVNYLIAKIKIENKLPEEAMLIVNDMLALIQKNANQAKIMYALFEKMYIDLVNEFNISNVDVELEEQNLGPLQEKLVILLK